MRRKRNRDPIDVRGIAAPGIRNRIKELRFVPAEELLPHDLNPRQHPEHQRQAVAALLEQIGYADALLAYETEDGRLRLFDGHLRRDLTPGLRVPVLVTDLTDAEARLMLRSVDATASMAEVDAERLDALIASLRTDFDKGALVDDERLNVILGELTAPTGLAPVDYSDRIVESWMIVVECDSEAHQRELLDRFEAEGLRCRALMS